MPLIHGRKQPPYVTQRPAGRLGLVQYHVQDVPVCERSSPPSPRTAPAHAKDIRIDALEEERGELRGHPGELDEAAVLALQAPIEAGQIRVQLASVEATDTRSARGRSHEERVERDVRVRVRPQFIQG
jgi:hypothetical protein